MKHLNDYKIIKAIKIVIYHIFKYVVNLEHILYSKFLYKKNKKIKRLFATTGNISLINVLAIINEIGNFDEYEDTLIIDTGKGRTAFLEKQLDIANLHKFKIICEFNLSCGVQAVLHNQYAFNEIYALNHPIFINQLVSLYPNAKVTLIDEGAGSLINYNSDKIKNLEKFKTHKYINKLDFLGLDNIEAIKFEPIDINEFRKIATILSDKYPIKYDLNINDKAILYCGVYWEVSGLSREKFIEVQSEMLKNLIDKGYKIIYKPHPRDNEFFGFDTNPNVIFVDSKFPIEIYNLDVVAVVSISSSASITPAHYWNIPCFSNLEEESISGEDNIVKNNVIRRIIKEYSPNYRELLNFDVEKNSKEELKLQIQKCYEQFLSSKPVLSKNQEIKEYIKQNER